MLPADAKICARDPALLGMTTLLDTDLFLKRVQEALPDLGVLATRATYVRYKSGTSCLVQYELQLSDRTCTAYAKAYDPSLVPKDAKQNAAEQDRGHCHTFPDIATVLYLFPYDARLNSLRLLASSDGLQDMLEETLPELGPLSHGTLRTLNYKAERRYTARLHDATSGILLKLYRDDEYSKAESKAKAFKSGEVLKVAKRLGRSRRHRLLVYRWLPGMPLDEALLTPDLDGQKIAAVGVALAELHGQASERLAPLSRAAEARRIWDLASLLGAVHPEVAKRLHTLAKEIVGMLIGLPAFYSAIHNDFAAKQVILLKRKVALIDFDEAVLGDPAADLGFFLANLEVASLTNTLGPREIEGIRYSLLTGYNTVPTQADDVARRIDLYVSIGLLTLMPHPFRYRHPLWPEHLEALVNRAESYLKHARSNFMQQVSIGVSHASS